MKKTLISALMLATLLPCCADEVPSLKIKTGDTEANIELSGIKNIKFSETNMIVNLKDGSEKTFSFDDITIIEFGSTTSAIKEILAEGSEDSMFSIADINGKTIIKGKNKDFQGLNMSLQRGIYVITTGKKTKKILVK